MGYLGLEVNQWGSSRIDYRTSTYLLPSVPDLSDPKNCLSSPMDTTNVYGPIYVMAIYVERIANLFIDYPDFD